jgi:hypothetical protein
LTGPTLTRSIDTRPVVADSRERCASLVACEPLRQCDRIIAVKRNYLIV